MRTPGAGPSRQMEGPGPGEGDPGSRGTEGPVCWTAGSGAKPLVGAPAGGRKRQVRGGGPPGVLSQRCWALGAGALPKAMDR